MGTGSVLSPPKNIVPQKKWIFDLIIGRAVEDKVWCIRLMWIFHRKALARVFKLQLKISHYFLGFTPLYGAEFTVHPNLPSLLWRHRQCADFREEFSTPKTTNLSRETPLFLLYFLNLHVSAYHVPLPVYSGKILFSMYWWPKRSAHCWRVVSIFRKKHVANKVTCGATFR